LAFLRVFESLVVSADQNNRVAMKGSSARTLPALIWILVAVPLMAQGELEPLMREIGSEVSPERAMQYVQQIYQTDRWFTFPKFQETAEHLKRTMNQIGLREAEIVAPPADGVSQFGYWTMPLAWDVKKARLEIVEPPVPEGFRVLADYEKVPASLGMWSGPTPEGGITAEVVELKDMSVRSIEALDLKGKMVLTPRNPADIKWLLARKGSSGAINAFTENPDLKDGRQWINAWGDNGWAFTKGNSPLHCFSISPSQAEFLRKLLREPRKVRVRAVVESRYYSGTYPYVTGIIPGSGDENEEVLVLGHMSEQGAHDNATGVAAMIEALGSLNRLIGAGRLPKPRRHIRMVAMGEMYGSMHYLATNPDRVRRTVAALCLDTPAASYGLAGTEYTFYMNPHAAKSYVDAFILRVAESYFSRLSPPRPWHWKEYRSGTDSFLGEPTIGIPTVWPYSGTGVHTHHNSEDKPETVDPRSLRDLTIVSAAYLYYLATASERETSWLGETALSRGQEQIVSAVTSILDSVSTAEGAERLGRLFHDGKERIDYCVAREGQAIRSVSRLTPEARREKARPWIESMVERLNQFGRDQLKRLEAALQRQASQLGLPTAIKPIPPPQDPQQAEAARIVVRRKRLGTIPLDELPPDQREGYPSGAWAAVPIRALYWCDGQRNLAEVARLTRLELGPSDFDFVGYFRFLERRGYVEFAK